MTDDPELTPKTSPADGATPAADVSSGTAGAAAASSGAPPASSGAVSKSAARPGRPADGDGSLLAILDRLTGLLERSDLTELEVASGETGLTLRKASALPVSVAAIAATAGAAAGAAGVESTSGAGTGSAPVRPSVKAPLTGIYYTAPGQGSAPYVEVGGEVAVGQVIGLIEAMKLFNEIKSDLAGRVVRVVAESGQLVKAKQPLIEVEPL
jgi:acetyl-CoA carboxylase biotin carboxyl carrier protein